MDIEMDMGRFDKASRTVEVTYKYKGVAHVRKVNAVLRPNGSYDRAATITRAEQVAQGVAAKIEAGVIR
ncbi:MAG: hypothetical protein QM645_11415 [Asticcacaulis sp.]